MSDHDEQRVRTMAGWIGVEISKSRKRRDGHPEFGLYRVRGQRNTAGGWVRSEWTRYALGLEAIRSAVEACIRNGTPAGPGSLVTGAGVVPTRWTQAYRGRRNLGVPQEPEVTEPVHVTVRPEFAAEVSALTALVDEGLVAMVHVDMCDCDGTERLTVACIQATRERSTVRSRRRAANDEFQAEHLKRRAYGLEQRHAAKLRLNGRGLNGLVDPPI